MHPTEPVSHRSSNAPSGTSSWRALAATLSSSLLTAWMWTPGIVAAALLPVLHADVASFDLVPWQRGDGAPLTPLGWLHVVAAMSAFTIAAFVQVAVAFEHANGALLRTALATALQRLLRAWPWAVVLIPAFTIVPVLVVTRGLGPLGILPALPFYVSVAVLPQLARGASHREAVLAPFAWLALRRVALTAFITGALFWVTVHVVVCAFQVGLVYATHHELFVPIVLSAAVVGLGVVLSTLLTALAR